MNLFDFNYLAIILSDRDGALVLQGPFADSFA